MAAVFNSSFPSVVRVYSPLATLWTSPFFINRFRWLARAVFDSSVYCINLENSCSSRKSSASICILAGWAADLSSSAIPLGDSKRMLCTCLSSIFLLNQATP